MDPRERIITEAAGMFRTYGIRAVTMDMLASRMGMSKRTIYEIFRDKDELLKGVLEWMAEKQSRLITNVMAESENVIEAIFKILDIMTQHFRMMSPAFRLDIRKYHNDIIDKIKDAGDIPYYAKNTDILMRGIREGIFRKDIDISITNKCILELVRLTNENEELSPDNFGSDVILHDFFINYIRGISTPKGLALIEFHEKKSISINKGHNKTVKE